jgi:hypothetical protein
MNFNKVPFYFLLKVVLALILVSVSLWVIIRKESRKPLFSYFDTRCIDYKQRDFSRSLNDKIVDYSAEAKRKGIKPCKDDVEIKEKISDGKLVRVKTGDGYVVDKMTYSYPCVTKDTKILIEEISERLREKTLQNGLKGVSFIITSMTRKTESMKRLRRNNQNASENSPHLYGNAFDISYKRFIVRKWVLTNCDRKFLKDALGEIISQLRDENKCFATYERGQNCFHVVAR